ncbi:MAG: beta-propeller fold lactonase family protein [Planctomycetes bacterium]|nr:beta-propeller fold lactonase family protein [Planctomycetota bacterium]
MNWESPHVHPLELTPDRKLLLAVNTPDNRLELLRFEAGLPVPFRDVPVGLDPVSVRARSSGAAWVVNRISDSVSVVDLDAGRVVATLATDDEPADVVFAGSPLRAFVSCSGANTVLVFDPERLEVAPRRIAIDGEAPRALAVSPDGSRVYAAIFESGNGSTILGGGALFNFDSPPNIVSRSVGPYGGRNPPPNSGREGGFDPPQRPGNPAPPPVGLIVKRNGAGQWRDDFKGDWTVFVSGPHAAMSGRREGWDLCDNDVAILDAQSGEVRYARGLMNACMALAVEPRSGDLTLVGTDATNEVRFEPVLRGRFLRVLMARLSPAGLLRARFDLNSHLDYASSSAPTETRAKSVGDPRAVVWNAGGTAAYVASMGSNHVRRLLADGTREQGSAPIPVGEGPTGLALDEERKQLYVLCKFESAVSVVSTERDLEVSRVALHDPSPAAIRRGRRHLYGTHGNSGLGHVSCASCHIDARQDHLAWDLGDPAGAVQELGDANRAADHPALLESLVPGRGPFEPFHPMKGPMTTQTLQDIVGKEPHHWRGDRAGLEAFNGAFESLLGAPRRLDPSELGEFEAFLATIAFEPNPFRGFDNSLPERLELAGHFTTGRFSPAGEPLPPGNARRGLELFRNGKLDNQRVDCVTCHTLPTGLGPDARLSEQRFRSIAPGTQGERHHMLVSQDGSSNVSMKVPQLRNLREKVGFDLSAPRSRRGFGFLHDGSVDTLARFVNEASFSVADEQQTADLVAFLLAFSGSDLPSGREDDLREPPGTASSDTHAAVGRQLTLSGRPSGPQGELLKRMLALADSGAVGVVARRGRQGWVYRGAGRFQSDRRASVVEAETLIGTAARGAELTLTVTPRGTEERIGVDRDSDGTFDGDELDLGTDPNRKGTPAAPRDPPPRDKPADRAGGRD